MVSVAEIARRVEALETVILEHASLIDDLQAQVSQLMARLPQPDTSADESTAARGSQAGSSAEPGVYPLAVEHSHPVNRVRKYYVVTVSVREDALEGIFTDYADYVYAVKDHSQTEWSGRGSIPFARGVSSQSFPSQGEAEAHYRSQTGLAADLPVPYRRSTPASRQRRRSPMVEVVRPPTLRVDP